MRLPICVTREDNGHSGFHQRIFYLRRPWARVGDLMVLRRWDSIWGDISGIEITVGQAHIELHWRHKEEK